jgi:hypothetical protein
VLAGDPRATSAALPAIKREHHVVAEFRPPLMGRWFFAVLFGRVSGSHPESGGTVACVVG